MTQISTQFKKSKRGTFGRRLTRKLNDSAVNKALLKAKSDAEILAELSEFPVISA